MKVFLSWHGEMSHKVALALRDWLPKVIQAVKPFISEDIGKGERWSDEVAQELNETTYGIVCLTPYNLKAPWINFEAGAISNSRTTQTSAVSPFLFNVEESKITGPLKQYQLTRYEKASIFSLLSSINSKLEAQQQLTPELLRQEFNAWWTEIDGILGKISEGQYEETETGYDWLYTSEDFKSKQEQINCKQIWVITPELFHRAVDPRIRKIVERNIARGIVYTFLTPDTGKIDDARKEVNSIFRSNPDQFIIKPIPEDEFQRLAVTDYIILNPDEDNTYPLNVFLELPIESRGYWIKVEYKAAIEFVNRFRQLQEKIAKAVPGRDETGS